MWLKLLRSVVLIRGILNAGIDFVRVLNVLSSFGRCVFLPLLQWIHNRSNTMSRTGHQAAILKPYPAKTHPPLQSVYSAFQFGVFFRLTVCRELTLGR